MQAQTHICHITVLNPVRHARIFHKLAMSQAKMGYRVSIVGQGTSTHIKESNGVTLYSLAAFSRLSFQRLLIGWRLLWYVRKIKPDVVVLHTPELLWVGWIVHFIGTKKVLYDVHENYAENTQLGTHYPSWLKRPLAAFIRWREKRAVRWLTGVSYAELSYDNMLEAPEDKKIVLRNSFVSIPSTTNISLPDKPYMLYTGTLARAWGVMETLVLWKKIQAIRPLMLVVAGFGYDEKLLDEIEIFVQASGFPNRFRLIGGRTYVPYEQIIALIQSCWFGTALYHPLPQTIHKLPTKFYEYGALGKPLLFTSAPYWESQNKEWEFGIPHHPTASIEVLLEKLENWEEKKPDTAQSIFSWTTDEQHLQAALARWIGSPTSE